MALMKSCEPAKVIRLQTGFFCIVLLWGIIALVLKCRAQEFVNHDCKLGAYLNLSKFSFQGLLVLVWQLFIEFHTKPLCKAIFYSIIAICVIKIFQEWDNFKVQFCSTNDSGILIPHTFRLSTYQIKVDKYQKVFSFLSHLQKNAWNCCPSTFQPNGKNWWTVILHNFLNMRQRWK